MDKEEVTRILVVDDEEDLCEILKFNLEAEGYEVDTANSGEEALEKDVASYHLVLLDVMMGGMSGFAVARRMRDNERTRLVPIIFLTAKGAESDKVTGFNLGADDYISKPFSIREVLLRVRAVLRRTSVGNADVELEERHSLEFKGLVVDSTARPWRWTAKRWSSQRPSSAFSARCLSIRAGCSRATTS